jgi:hypothetical protein
MFLKRWRLSSSILVTIVFSSMTVVVVDVEVEDVEVVSTVSFSKVSSGVEQ